MAVRCGRWPWSSGEEEFNFNILLLNLKLERGEGASFQAARLMRNKFPFASNDRYYLRTSD